MEKLLIFGAGRYSEYVYSVLKTKFDVIGFVDNDINKQGEFCCGFPILSPSKFFSSEAEKYDTFKIAIAVWTEKISSQIFEQCLNCGISKEDIIIFSKWRCYENPDIPTIPLGSAYGGYRVHSHISYTQGLNTVIVFSFGTGDDISFEEELLQTFNAEIYAFDPTPRAIRYIEGCDLDKHKFHFFPLGLEAFDGIAVFDLPPEGSPEFSGNVLMRDFSRHGSKIEVQMKRLATIMSELEINHIDILKMDIEGSEFAVIEDVLESKISFDQLCVEFHDRFFVDGKEKLVHVFNLLKEHGYTCCFFSRNAEEATFARKSFIQG